MTGFLNPKTVLKEVELRANMTAADFGSGSGGWAIPLAKQLKEGKVYAIDILEEPLSALNSRAKLEKILNIQTLQSDVEKTSKLFGKSCDLVLMTNLLFEVEDKKKVLEEGKRVLRDGGKLLIIDWQPEALLGPKEERISTGEVKKMAKDLNLKLEKEFTAGIYHWGLILVK